MWSTDQKLTQKLTFLHQPLRDWFDFGGHTSKEGFPFLGLYVYIYISLSFDA